MMEAIRADIVSDKVIDETANLLKELYLENYSQNE